MAWLGKEELLKRIISIEPNYSLKSLTKRSEGQLYKIYEYLLEVKRPRPTAKQVLKIEECDIQYSTNQHEEYLYDDEITMMYPEGGQPVYGLSENSIIVNLGTDQKIHPTAVRVIHAEECDIDFENMHRKEEFLYPHEISMMYPESDESLPNQQKDYLIVNLRGGDGFKSKK